MARDEQRMPRSERPAEDEDETTRDIGEDEEFDELEDVDEEEEEPEGRIVDEEMTGDNRFTSEIGSEGGTQGDLMRSRRQSGTTRGSEATETGRPSGRDRETFDRGAGRP